MLKIVFLHLLTLFFIIFIENSHGNEDLEFIYKRRLESILVANYDEARADQWSSELTSEGVWTDVDYTAGCPARRANWPAQYHFHRINTMASTWWHNQSDTNLRAKISLALDWWNDRDYTEEDCINAGGRDNYKCPCGTPGMWNSNWYDQMILLPGLFAQICLTLNSSLTTTQFGNCTNQMSRAYKRIDGDPNGSMGAMTGANMLDVASTGVSLGLLTNDVSLVSDAIGRYYNEARVTSGSADGIKVDGSFMQHDAQLYNGNYGSVFMRTMFKIFLETQNTSFTPPEAVQSSFLRVINASEWFIYRKVEPRVLSWQYSVIGRMVSHKYEDWHGIGWNLDEILEATKFFGNAAAYKEIIGRLSEDTDLNPGGLVGTRYFHTTDYMVHRGENYIVSLKMFSKRTTNSECNNNQNPYGFHLSDGAIYTYKNGDEYTNVYGAWDWNLIPGTTVNYGVTPLSCSRVQHRGKESYVGGVASGNAGLAIMNYTNPLDGSHHWLKTYFFFPDAYFVQFVGQPFSNPTAPIYTTLDQRQKVGPVYIDYQLMKENFTTKLATSLWHDRVEYQFLQPVNLTVDTREKQSNWSDIGISVGNETQSLFAAYFQHYEVPGPEDQYTYAAILDTDLVDYQRKLKNQEKLGVGNLNFEKNTFATAEVRGAYVGTPGGEDRIISLAFLTSGESHLGLPDITMVETDAPCLLIFQAKPRNEGWTLTISDPGQALSKIHVLAHLSNYPQPVDLNIEMPSGDWAGSSKVIEF